MESTRLVPSVEVCGTAQENARQQIGSGTKLPTASLLTADPHWPITRQVVVVAVVGKVCRYMG